MTAQRKSVSYWPGQWPETVDGAPILFGMTVCLRNPTAFGIVTAIEQIGGAFQIIVERYEAGRNIGSDCWDARQCYSSAITEEQAT